MMPNQVLLQNAMPMQASQRMAALVNSPLNSKTNISSAPNISQPPRLPLPQATRAGEITNTENIFIWRV